MRFKKKYDIRDQDNRSLIAQGCWRPNARDYKDIIEDYLRISRIRRNNKLAISKLQIQLLEDLITHNKIIDNLNQQLEKNTDSEKEKYIKQEIFAQELIVRNLYDLADGITFRYFDYDRALLYYLGEKPSSGPIRPHQGMLAELQVWSEAFDYGQGKAIINDITKYLRIGDVTIFRENGEIEFVEVKSSKSTRGKERRSRLLRQQERLNETVKFFNTGITEFDGQDLLIKKIPVTLNYRFDLIENTIKEAENMGLSHIIIDDFLIVECVDFEKAKSAEEIIAHFEKHTSPIRNTWNKNGDVLFGPTFFNERLDFSHNLTPLSVWPLSDSICADLMMGRIMLTTTVNISIIKRRFEESGWRITKSIFEMDKEEVEATGMKSLMTINKNGFFVEIPPGMFARIIFEFLSPQTLINTFEWERENTPRDQGGLVLLSYENENNIWN